MSEWPRPCPIPGHPARRRRRTSGDHRIGVDAAAGLAPARPRRAAAAARRLGHLAGGVGDALAPGPRPCRRLDRRRGHRRDVAGLGPAEPAGTQSPPGQPGRPGDAGAGPVLADRGGAGRGSRGEGGSPPPSRSAPPPGRTGGRPWSTWPGRPAGTGGCAGMRRSKRPASAATTWPPTWPTRSCGIRSCPGSGWTAGMCSGGAPPTSVRNG